MVQGFFILSCAVIVALFGCILWISRIEADSKKAIQLMLSIALFTVLFNGVATACQVKWLSDLTHGLYFAATDWLVISLLLYCQKYTQNFQNHLWGMIPAFIVSITDSISMVVNVWTHHVFDSVVVKIEGYDSYMIVPKNPSFLFHLICVYFAVGLVMLSLIGKMIMTVKLYRKKYEAVFFGLLAILVVNIGCRFMKVPFDLSPLLYFIVAISICYFTLFYVPKGIIATLLSDSIADMTDGIICYDVENKCIYANEKAKQFFNTDLKDGKLERYFTKWLDGRDITKIEKYSWQKTLEEGEDTRYYEMTFNPLHDDAKKYIGCFVSIYDYTKMVVQLEKERYRATYDHLTGVYNREGFFAKVREKLDEEPEVERLMICSDIKDFKLVNDLFGKGIGDDVLKLTASVIREQAMEGTVFGRLNADRFAMCVLAKNYDASQYERCVKEICRLASNNVYRMHMHIGVYKIHDRNMEISVMCDRAFTAIERIKDSYETVISYYDATIGANIHLEKQMIGEFEKAIEENQFMIYLQPQVSADNKVLGAEALVRWMHPDKGLIPPGEFIPTFEKAGFIHRLDRHVWELACKQLKKWKDRGIEDYYLSVNISPKDFYYIDIYETFTGLVEQYGVSPEKIKLEITESAIMQDVNKQINRLERLREYGFQIEIDDFGSGYSSLNTLKDFEVDVLKMDLGFLRETFHVDRSRIILDSVIEMSKKLGLVVVAEGVETENQVEYLKHTGCDIFQGYYFARPMKVAEFEEKYIN